MKLLVAADKEFLKKIPNRPGVYRFYANEGEKSELLYIGKAINLSKRVKSYFQKTTGQSPRISLMISRISEVELTITDNEASALILENSLIKSLKPKYNIIFRDDKSYPLIRVSEHEFPKIDVYRGKTNSRQNEYFGPYPNVQAVTHAINLIQKLFKLRTCVESVFKNRSRPCMLYQIKLCTAPCVGYVNSIEYRAQVDLALKFLRGNYQQIVADLTLQMNEKAASFEFEAAALIRDKITLLSSISKGQIINNHNQPITADVIIAKANANRIFIYLISLQHGIYSVDKHFVLNDPDSNLSRGLEVFFQNYYLEHQRTKLVYLKVLSDGINNHLLDNDFLHMFYAATGVKILSVRSQMIKKISHMAEINLERVIRNASLDNELKLGADKLAGLLQLKTINRIECIDVSHNQGTNAIVSCVVYQDGKIDNSLYRRYSLPSGINGDDLAGMKHMLVRRFKAVDLALPEVIVVDGGITQFNMVKNLIDESGLCDKIRVVSIFKGEKRNPQYDRVIINASMVVGYKDDPLLFKLLQSLRDEAHRFAITGHRVLQIKTMAVSKLEDIAGIGVVKRSNLLRHFGGLKGVMQASVDELQQVTGISFALAQQIFAYFHNE